MADLRKKLMLGTVQFGLDYGIANQSGQVSHSSAMNILNVAFENGIELLDTAVGYGVSEECLGACGVDRFDIVTKLPVFPEQCSDVSSWVQKNIADSLARLRKKRIYGVLLHRPNQLLTGNGEALYRSLLALKEQGIVRKVGISIYSPDELGAICPHFDVDIVQAPFNLVDRRLQTSGWLSKLKDKKIEVHTRSAFLQGLLLMGVGSIPTKFSRWNAIWEEWHNWLLDVNLTALQVSLAYPLSVKEIDRILVGVDTVEQMKEIADAARAYTAMEFPAVQSDDKLLVNPSKWASL